MTIDWTKPIETIDGRPAKVLPYEPKNFGLRCVVVDDMPANTEYLYLVDVHGYILHFDKVFIVNVPEPPKEPRSVFITAHPEGRTYRHWYDTRAEAERSWPYPDPAVEFREVVK